MTRLLALLGVLAGLAAATLALPTAASAAPGYWRYTRLEITPTEEQLRSYRAGGNHVLEQHVTGGLSGAAGSLQLYRKTDDADYKVWIHQLTYTFAANQPLGTLVPGRIVRFTGDVNLNGAFPGTYGNGHMAANDGDYAMTIDARAGQPAHGAGQMTIPGGSPGETFRLVATAYVAGYGALGGTMTLFYQWVPGAPQPIPDRGGANGGQGGGFGGHRGDSGGGFAGDWSTSEGDMSLSAAGDRVSGTYSQDNGRIDGHVSGRHLTGYWSEAGSAQDCGTVRLGSRFWGRVDWVLSADGRRFEGRWGYCDATPATRWTGDRRGGRSAVPGGHDEGMASGQEPADHHDQGYGHREGGYQGQDYGHQEGGYDHQGQDYGHEDHGGAPWGGQEPQHGWAAPPQPPTSAAFYDNWNTAACGFTDRAEFDVPRPIRLEQLQVWYNWAGGETSIDYAVTQDGRQVGSGVLRRESCDPFQTSWCVAADTPGADLAPGHYEVRVARGAICQNGGSGGRGFIKLFGH